MCANPLLDLFNVHSANFRKGVIMLTKKRKPSLNAVRAKAAGGTSYYALFMVDPKNAMKKEFMKFSEDDMKQLRHLIEWARYLEVTQKKGSVLKMGTKMIRPPWPAA